MQASSILNRMIAIGLITSHFPPLQNTPPVTTTDLLQAINFDMEKYGQPTTSNWFWTWKDVDIYFEVT
jgi:hypothetical protein